MACKLPGIKSKFEGFDSNPYGVDPESGEVFPPESAYQRPLVVRALYEAAAALERQERYYRRKAQLPVKTGEPYVRAKPPAAAGCLPVRVGLSEG